METLLIVLLMLFAGLVGFLIGRERLRGSLQTQIRDVEGKATAAEARATAAEASCRELRLQLAQRDVETSGLRNELTEEGKRRASAETALVAERKNLEEEKALLQEAREKLKDAFKALASDALQSNNAAFLELAKRTLETARAEATGELDQRKEAIRGLVDPLSQALKRYEDEVQKIEVARQQAYGDLGGLLRDVKQTQESLQHEASNLVTALRRPGVRGRWGELTLKRVAELAGMAEHCDFDEQVTVGSEDEQFRPDMVVNMPGSVYVPVDSKAPIDSYLDAAQATNDKARKEHLERHAKNVREHMRQLASKAYWDQFDKTPQVTVLFLPGEPFLSAAVEFDPTLIEDAIQNRILFATPMTLVALLRAVAYGWKQEQVAKNAQEISELGKQIFERFAILWKHLADIGSSLRSAVNAFDSAVGSLERRLAPSVRRFKQLGVSAPEEIAELEPIDQTPRSVSALPPPDTDDNG